MYNVLYVFSKRAPFAIVVSFSGLNFTQFIPKTLRCGVKKNYACSTDLNWDSSYMVSSVMDIFTAAHHVREVANTVAVWSQLRENFENTPNFHES